MGMEQGVRTGLGHGSIICVLQTQFTVFVFFFFFVFFCFLFFGVFFLVLSSYPEESF